jgi:hypothetical protein
MVYKLSIINLYFFNSFSIISLIKDNIDWFNTIVENVHSHWLFSILRFSCRSLVSCELSPMNFLFNWQLTLNYLTFKDFHKHACRKKQDWDNRQDASRWGIISASTVMLELDLGAIQIDLLKHGFLLWSATQLGRTALWWIHVIV